MFYFNSVRFEKIDWFVYVPHSPSDFLAPVIGCGVISIFLWLPWYELNPFLKELFYCLFQKKMV